MNKFNTWLAWLMPRPWDYVSTLLTVGVVAVHFFLHLADVCPVCGRFTLLDRILLVGGAVLLLTLDRVEYWRYGEIPPKRMAVALFLLRTLLIVTISIADNFNLSLFLFLFIPFTSFPVFGAGVSYTLAVMAWLFYFVKITPAHPLWYHDVEQVIFFSIYTLGLVFIVAMLPCKSPWASKKLRLHDNGKGFDPTQLSNEQSAGERGYGLPGVRERLELIGGALRVESAPNQGTTLWVVAPKQRLPLAQQ